MGILLAEPVNRANMSGAGVGRLIPAASGPIVAAVIY